MLKVAALIDAIVRDAYVHSSGVLGGIFELSVDMCFRFSLDIDVHMIRIDVFDARLRTNDQFLLDVFGSSVFRIYLAKALIVSGKRHRPCY